MLVTLVINIYQNISFYTIILLLIIIYYLNTTYIVINIFLIKMVELKIYCLPI